MTASTARSWRSAAHREDYVRPPLTAAEPVGRLRHRRRVRLALCLVTLVLLAVIALVVAVTAGGSHDDPGVDSARLSLTGSASSPSR